MNPIESHQTILIVEDNDIDFEATHRAFIRGGIINPIQRCSDGDDALDYLFQRGRYDEATAPRPGLVLLDLNLPGTDGREVLREAKGADATKKIPIIVLTTSGYEHDVDECYRDGANSYIQKPVGVSSLFETIQRLRDYWLGLTILPKP